MILINYSRVIVVAFFYGTPLDMISLPSWTVSPLPPIVDIQNATSNPCTIKANYVGTANITVTSRLLLYIANENGVKNAEEVASKRISVEVKPPPSPIVYSPPLADISRGTAAQYYAMGMLAGSVYNVFAAIFNLIEVVVEPIKDAVNSIAEMFELLIEFTEDDAGYAFSSIAPQADGDVDIMGNNKNSKINIVPGGSRTLTLRVNFLNALLNLASGNSLGGIYTFNPSTQNIY